MSRKQCFSIIVLLIVAVLFGGNLYAYASSDSEIRYYDAPTMAPYASEVVNYTRKVVVAENYTATDFPSFFQTSEFSNACGPVAGAEVIAFYDKYYPNMMSDWESYFPSTGRYKGQDSTVVPALVRDLYVRMRTNVDDVGVSQHDCIVGLKNYINDHGYDVSYLDAKSGNSINSQWCKDAIDSNKVILLFTTATTVYDLFLGENRDTISPKQINGAHVMVIYGYYQVEYYNIFGRFRTDTYLAVVTGLDILSYKLYKLNSSSTVSAYIVTIQ